jgi:SH3 domain-containing YSC84-like protein 1
MNHLTLSLLLTLSSIAAYAGDSAEDLNNKANKATKVLSSLADELEIPRAMINGGDCLAAVTILKGGFAGFGAKTGQGLVTCKTKNGWSNPSVINVNGGSFGPQIGIGKIAMVMVFVGEKSVNQLKKDSVTGDLQVSLVAGPMGREAMAGVDFKLENGIYSYAKAKGLYAGATIGAALISPDKSSNTAIYEGTTSADISTILETPANDDLPEAFKNFLNEIKVLS